MMAELCYHIVDLLQNSAAANAENIFIRLEQDQQKDIVILEIRDDGKGMNAETVKNVQDPFYTTKIFKKVGLGIPMLKQIASMCDGDFHITSQPGQGTTVWAQLKYSHIDRPPVGDVHDTILTSLVGTGGADRSNGMPAPNVDFTVITDGESFHISNNEIKDQIGDTPISHPDVLSFLRQYIAENV